MMNELSLSVLLLIIGVVVLALFFLLGKKKEAESHSAFQRNFDIFNREMENMRRQIEQVSSQLNERMKETSTAIINTHAGVGARVDNATKVISDVQNKLGALEESNKKIMDVAEGLKDLKDIFKNPKLRGNTGEIFLEELLSQIFPREAYETQYRFLSGEKVDVAIRIGKFILPIDSKFPIESFTQLLKIPDDQVEEKKRQKKKFNQNILLHAKSISQKYIKPDEGTFDFSFMYIPAENVYYETIIRDDSVSDGDSSLYSGLLEKRVIPVSPHTFYCYLQVIIRGLKGMRIEEDAKRILDGLGGISIELQKFQEDYSRLGTHIKNSYNSFDGGAKSLDKIKNKYSNLENSLSIDSKDSQV